MADADEAQDVNPFKVITKGEDTVNKNDEIVFADFRPQILPADTPDPKKVVAGPSPKGVSAPEPAPSSGSTETTGQTVSENPVQGPAVQDSGQNSPGVDLKQTSSSGKKTG